MDPQTAEFDDGFFYNGGCRRSYLEKGETFPGRRGLEAMHFAAMVYRMDLGIGRIVKALEEKGVADNTLILFTSDNGRSYGYGEWLAKNHPFTGHKSEMLDGGIRVPPSVTAPARPTSLRVRISEISSPRHAE